MRTVNDKIEGDVNLLEDLQLNGLITGSVTVTSGVNFHLNGMVSKNVRLEPGSNAVINGTVSGELRNEGGTVTIGGVVGILVKIAGTTTVRDGAVVKKSLGE